MSSTEQRTINLSRVQRCDQDWNGMPTVVGGRQCLHCDKRIVDFTGMSPGAIAHVHLSSAAPVCGRYTDEQLNGTNNRSAPTTPWRRSPVVVSLLALLLTEPAEATAGEGPALEQSAAAVRTPDERAPTATAAADSTVLRGRVFTHVGQAPEGLPFVNVVVVGTAIRTSTDFDGHFSLDLTPLDGQADSVLIEVLYVGYRRQQQRVALHRTEDLVFELSDQDLSEIAFAVTYKKPPLHKRIWRGLQRPFRK
ncbi:MAG: carboxypeptidase-like regulatory domain-containing protein [Flavobacteriales bacterium]|nr:carboxypeptidase-like regulatory domain-containing protein [Flavobacteriales bacterium]